MTFKTIDDLNVNGKVVLLRADLNVPQTDGMVTDTTRIDRLRPTIDKLKKEKAKIVILSHFGRPNGEKNTDYSLSFIIPVLEKIWETPVLFADDCIDDTAKMMIARMGESDVLLLENVRFHAGEEANDPAFTKQLAVLGDVFVNDAFSAAHRAHASTEGLAHHLPSAAGLMMEAELNALQNALEAPQKTVAALVGGSKTSTKLSVLNNLVHKVDYLVLGGGMANTFLLAQGHNIGKSLCESDMLDEANRIAQTAKDNNCEIVLPIDCVVVEDLGAGVPYQTVTLDHFPDTMSAIDIGEQSIAHIEGILDQCKTVLWNGPMGVFEIKPFDRGTNAIAEKVAALTQRGRLVSVAGGGDTVSALENAKVIKDMTYVSTAGGAFLEWLEGKTLPGVAALMTAQSKAA